MKKKAVFLETKRPMEDLEKDENQLLEYSFADGVEIAVLTNGLLWWLYFPLGKDNWKQRGSMLWPVDILLRTASC